MRVPTDHVELHEECFPHNQIARPLALTDGLCQISVRRRPTRMAGDDPLRLRARINPNSSEPL